MAMCAITFMACDNNKSSEPPLPPDPVITPEALTAELRPVLSEGKLWVFEDSYRNIHDGSTSTLTYTGILDGDTEAGGLAAKKIRLYSGEGQEFGIPIVRREENGNVYRYWYFNDGYDMHEIWGLSYNITPQTDVTIVTPQSHIITISRGTIVLQGKTRRAIKVWVDFNEKHRYPYDYVVEGIGPLFGSEPIYSYSLVSHGPEDEMLVYSRLLECYDGEEKIYDHREFNNALYVPEVVFTDIDLQQ